MKNINKLRLAVVLTFYLVAFTVDTVRATEKTTIKADIILVVNDNVIQAPYNIDITIKVLDEKQNIVMYRTDGYLDFTDYKKKSYFIVVDGFEPVKYTPKNKVNYISLVKKQSFNADEVKAELNSIISLLSEFD